MAILAVVVYHAAPSWLPGGFVGVDVFFVISGFLITDHLWREIEGQGRVSMAAFYARRARRLLPAASLVVVVTMVASAVVLPPLQLRSVWIDGVASALYVANYRFAATGTNYLAATGAPSPFQNFWSLGVEEQFYLVWPLILVAASVVWFAGRRARRGPPGAQGRRPSRAGATAALAGVLAVSLALSLWLTRADEPFAFFSLPTRAWELAAGGLVALGAPWLRRAPAALAAAVGWGGLGAVLLATVVFGARTPFPGTAALLPVLGALGVVAGGLVTSAAGPVVVLGKAGPRAIGRISYSWYLWHWPALVLAPYALGEALSAPAGLAVAAGSGVLAALTYALVEAPGRRARWPAVRPRRGLAIGAALSLSGAATCAIAVAASPSVAGHGLAPVARLASPPISVPRRGAAPGSPTRRGGGSGRSAPASPVLAALDAAQAQVAAAVDRSVGVKAVPANLDPPLAYAASSEAAPMVDGCLLGFTAVTGPLCLFGDTSASRSVLLFGDSHAAMWFPAVDAWALAHGYRLYVWTKAACPPVAITLFSPVLGRTWSECSAWRTGALAAAAALHPRLSILGIAPNYDYAYNVVQNGPAWERGLVQVVHSLQGDGSSVLVMGSVPSPVPNIPDCLSANLTDAPACDIPRVGTRNSGGGLDGVDLAGEAREAAAVTSAGAAYADVVPWLCATKLCPAVVDNLLVYRDNSHLTVPYVSFLAPLVADEIDLAFGARR